MGNMAAGIAAWITITRFNSTEQGKYLARSKNPMGRRASRTTQLAAATGKPLRKIPGAITSARVAPVSNKPTGTALCPIMWIADRITPGSHDLAASAFNATDAIIAPTGAFSEASPRGARARGRQNNNASRPEGDFDAEIMHKQHPHRRPVKDRRDNGHRDVAVVIEARRESKRPRLFRVYARKA